MREKVLNLKFADETMHKLTSSTEGTFDNYDFTIITKFYTYVDVF